jgi:cellobiose phosphorylase
MGNAECQIDALPQSWAVLSGVGSLERSRLAMDEVERRLVSREDRLIRLFTPPFDRSELDPGYIKGYVPGVRENGGQYTHAAIWTIMAFAELGETERAWDLWHLVNPVTHADSPTGVATYQVEPYVVAADVYALAARVGRGGWTWYTGSAGWMYRLLTESLLGLRLEPTRLRIEPRLPAAWTGFTVHYRYRGTHYHIQVSRRGSAPPRLLVDEVEQASPSVLPLNDDGGNHRVRLEI